MTLLLIYTRKAPDCPYIGTPLRTPLDVGTGTLLDHGQGRRVRGPGLLRTSSITTSATIFLRNRPKHIPLRRDRLGRHGTSSLEVHLHMKQWRPGVSRATENPSQTFAGRGALSGTGIGARNPRDMGQLADRIGRCLPRGRNDGLCTTTPC